MLKCRAAEMPSYGAIPRNSGAVVTLGDSLTEGWTHVILQGGGNELNFSDLGWPNVSAEEIIAGYEEIRTRVHAKGLKILGGTLTPFKGFQDFWTPVREAKREAINDWIRNSQAFDGVTDFDAALRDPDDPERLHPVFDSGDHGHLNDAGYAVMAFEAESELINLRGGPW